MLKVRGRSATANLQILEFVARKLGVLNEEVIYLGGCSIALFITDILLSDVRPTIDVDCIVDIASKTEYYKFSKKLEKQGFKQKIDEPIICRWYYDNIILDVMPIDKSILNFSNHWYKEAIEITSTHQLTEDLIIKSVTAPYLLATKIEAFQSRGNRDFLASNDLEDIINIISGRVEIVEEIKLSKEELKKYIIDFFGSMIKNEDFLTALPGHINEGPVTTQQLAVVINRIKNIITN